MSLTERIGTAFVAAVLIQIIAGLIWAGAAAQRLDYLESQLARSAALEVRAARLEEQNTHLRSALERIERKLDRALVEESDHDR